MIILNLVLNREPAIILASSSPRRRQLLAEAGYKFKVVVPDVDESEFPADMKPCRYAEQLALAKAKSVAAKFPDSLVIGADTVVDFDGEIIGKAADAKEAEQIIRKIFSRPHKVITAVAIVRLRDGVEIVQSDTTTVYPKRMTDEQIAGHIKRGSWRDKAGAYAISASPLRGGRDSALGETSPHGELAEGGKESGDEFVERIEGSLTNVMGLPMELLERLLGKYL